MKIKYTDQYGTDILDVFSIYWGMRNEGTKEEEVFTYFYAIYGPQDVALGVYDSKEVEIVDSALKGKWTYFANRYNGIFYAPLIEERLLDDVIDRDPEAIKKFLQFAIKDGLLDAELYKDAL